MWGEPDRGTRIVLGELWRDSAGYAFAYGHEVERAMQHGFRMLAEFPDLRFFQSPYRSRHLFATFAQRVPSPKRADFARIMDSWGIENVDDPLEILARSGGVQMTDRIELAEHRSSDDELDTPLQIRLAGMKYYSGGAQIRPGIALSLVREPENERDSSAVAIVVNGTKAGYVPRQYSALIARLLDRGVRLAAVAVRQLGVPADEGRWVVNLERINQRA